MKIEKDVVQDYYYDIATAAKANVDKFWDEFADWANEITDEMDIDIANRVAIDIAMSKVASEIKKQVRCNYEDAFEAIKVVLMCGAKKYYNAYDEANECYIKHEYSSWQEAIAAFAFEMPSTKEVVFFLQ